MTHLFLSMYHEKGIVPTNEELVIAEDVSAILSGDYSDHLHYDYSFARTDFAPLRSA